MKRSIPPAVHKFGSFATWALIALICLVAIPTAADTSKPTTFPTWKEGKAWGSLWANRLPTHFGTLLAAPPPLAATINVNSTLQSPGAAGDCTLGEAILAANSNLTVDGCSPGSSVAADTIMLPAGTYTLTTIAFTHPFYGAAGLPGITSDVVVQGAGSSSTIIERSDGATDQFRLMLLGNGIGSIVLNDLTMRKGRSPFQGGALYTGGRPATLNRVVFDDNRAQTGGAVVTSDQGGAVIANDCIFKDNQATTGHGGAIVGSPVTISNGTFTGNSAVYGGALYFIQGGEANFNIADSTFTNNQATATGGIGGAIFYSGAATITRSLFTGNSAGSSNSSGGALAGNSCTLNLIDSVVTGNQATSGGGLHLSNSSFNITRSTISNNTAGTHFGGGLYLNSGGGGTVSASTINGNSAGIDGGGLWAANISLILANVTIDENTSGRYGGGIHYQAGGKTITLNNVTITGNHAASQGGGFRLDSNCFITAKNSIIALNTTSNAPDIYAPTLGSFTSLGYNLIGIKDGATFTNATGDLTGTNASPINPLLGPLQDNGGTTSTRALLAGSPAIDAASPAAPGTGGNSFEPSDQRGVSRPQDGDNNGSAICDIGAYEQVRVPVCIPPPSGIVAWWPFDGDANDIQGVDHAMLVGEPTFAVGKVDQALTFDGIDDHAVVPAAAGLDIGSAGGMTFGAWINPPEIQTARPLIEWNSGTGPHLWMSADFGEGGQGVGSLFVNLTDITGSFHIFSSAPGLLRANTWQHVAVTYDKTLGIAKIYLNGTAVAQQNLGSFTPQTAVDLYFGYRPEGVLGGRRFLGSMDEVELFNRALDATEIQAIYYADYAGKCKPDPTPTPTPAVIEVTEHITVTDTPILLPSAMIGVNENISVHDTPTLLPSAMIGVNENISVLDTPTLLPSAMIGVNESISVHDTPTLLPSAMIGVNENISVHDAPSLLPSVMIGVLEQINVLDILGLLPVPVTVSFPTSVGTNVTVGTGAATITFEKVTVAGTTTITPIDLSSTGQLPSGYQLAGTSFAFDITTTAQYSGLITICFSVPSVTDPAVFANLRVLHNENGTLVDRTSSHDFATRMICATVKSLSPFVVAQLVSGPQLLLQATANDLQTLRQTITDKQDQQKLDEITRQLDGALDAGNWLDQIHLIPNRGENVFGKIESAILKLAELSKDKKTTIAPAVLEGFVKRLLHCARLLAQTAIIDASSTNGNTEEIMEAIEALFQGDTKVAAGENTQALNNYREAWRRALHAGG